METLSQLHIGITGWSIALLCGFLIGLSKVGVPGTSMIVVPLMAIAFGAKPSTGLLLPILMAADVFGVSYYRRHANWSYLVAVLPWAITGLLIALWVGEKVNEDQFKNLIAVIVFFSIALMLWQDKKKNTQSFPHKWWFAPLMGIMGGFATMIGNVAGPIFSIYLLSMKSQKNSFIGTQAWFFMIVNFAKFPLQWLVWHNINSNTLFINLVSLPAIAVGAFLGIKIVKIIPEKTYRGFVIIITTISAFLLLL
jgi:uncharacterized protein